MPTAVRDGSINPQTRLRGPGRRSPGKNRLKAASWTTLRETYAEVW